MPPEEKIGEDELSGNLSQEEATEIPEAIIKLVMAEAKKAGLRPYRVKDGLRIEEKLAPNEDGISIINKDGAPVEEIDLHESVMVDDDELRALLEKLGTENDPARITAELKRLFYIASADNGLAA